MSQEESKVKTVNPFAPQSQGKTLTVGQESEVQKQIAEIQSALVIAKRFPRDPAKAYDALMLACQRPKLAEEALYTYKRGSTIVEGPSIRLAEASAQCWGNMEFGFRELSNENGRSEVGAFAWDLETNTKRTLTFYVNHTRHTKGGSYVLTDPRDIYEMVANQAQRRVRACILACIPGDVIDDAVKQCYSTMENNVKVTENAIKQMLNIFESEFSIDKQAIEKWLGRRVDSITSPQMVRLKNIRQSLKDGISRPADWFDIPDSTDPAAGKKTDTTQFDKSPGKVDETEMVDESTGEVNEQSPEGTEAPAPGEPGEGVDESPQQQTLVDEPDTGKQPEHSPAFQTLKAEIDNAKTAAEIAAVFAKPAFKKMNQKERDELNKLATAKI